MTPAAYSITRWNLSDKEAVHSACVNRLKTHFDNGETDASPMIEIGPTDILSANQYHCARSWASVELAQAWVEYVQTIGIPCLYTEVRPA